MFLIFYSLIPVMSHRLCHVYFRFAYKIFKKTKSMTARNTPLHDDTSFIYDNIMCNELQ